MIVLDAGIVVAMLVGGLEPERFGDEELAAPHLLDSEVLNALRRLIMRNELTEAQGQAAVAGFLGLTLTRYGASPLRRRIWELRHNLSSYDATYLALAEAIGATALWTTDARIARAPELRCRIEVVD